MSMRKTFYGSIVVNLIFAFVVLIFVALASPAQSRFTSIDGGFQVKNVLGEKAAGNKGKINGIGLHLSPLEQYIVTVEFKDSDKLPEYADERVQLYESLNRQADCAKHECWKQLTELSSNTTVRKFRIENPTFGDMLISSSTALKEMQKSRRTELSDNNASVVERYTVKGQRGLKIHFGPPDGFEIIVTILPVKIYPTDLIARR